MISALLTGSFLNWLAKGLIMVSGVAAANTAHVTAAIKQAGAETGAGFDVLMKMAMRESSLDPAAKAKTSSAAGLFQFIEQTWLGAVKTYGAKHGLAAQATAITRGENGRYQVAESAVRDEILKLRFNPESAAAMAGELANENKSYLERHLGRAAGGAEIYAAHFLGPAGAVKLLSAGAGAKAADLLPAAAAANKHVFYDGSRARSVGEVMASIGASMGEAMQRPAAHIAAPVKVAAAPAPAGLRPISNASVYRINENLATSSQRSNAHYVRDETAQPGGKAQRTVHALTLALLQMFDPASIRNEREERTERNETKRAAPNG